MDRVSIRHRPAAILVSSRIAIPLADAITAFVVIIYLPYPLLILDIIY